MKRYKILNEMFCHMSVGMQGGRQAAHQDRQRLTAFLTFLREAAQVFLDQAGVLQRCSVYNAAVRKEDVPSSCRRASFSPRIRLLRVIVAIAGARWRRAYHMVDVRGSGTREGRTRGEGVGWERTRSRVRLFRLSGAYYSA